jgi:hypothetical protein
VCAIIDVSGKLAPALAVRMPAACGDAAGREAARREGCSAETCPLAVRVRCWLETAARDVRQPAPSP